MAAGSTVGADCLPRPRRALTTLNPHTQAPPAAMPLLVAAAPLQAAALGAALLPLAAAAAYLLYFAVGLVRFW